MSNPNLPVYDLPGHLIRRCHQISVGIFHDVCDQFDLTPIQYAALVAMRANPEIEQIALSGLIGVDRSTIGNVLLRLEKRGLILRRPDARDRRLRRLTITDQGIALLDAVEPQVAHVQERLLAPLDAAEQKEFMRLLRRIVDANNAESRVPVVA